MAGRRSAERGLVRQSMTTRLVMPVDSSAVSDDRRTFHEILVGDDAVDFGDHRAGVGVPLGERWPRLTVSPSSALRRAPYWMRCTARSAPSGPTITTAMLRLSAISSPSEFRATLRLRMTTVPSKFEFDERLVGDLRRAADVERAHGELGARLADRLRRDDADSLAHVDGRAAGEVASVAGAADAVCRLAGENRTDLHLLDTGGGDRLDVPLLDHRALGHDHAAGLVDQVLSRGAAEDAGGQRRDDLAGIDDRHACGCRCRNRNRAR